MTDVVVIGAGGTGAVVAKELAEAGLQVVVLEAGPWHDPERDFTGLEWDMFNPFDSVFRWGPPDRRVRPWPRERDGVGWLLQTAGVGGNTLHFGGNYPRAYPAAIDAAWPYPYRDLIPYFERVEETLPVVVPDLLAHKDELFVRGCEGAGIPRLSTPDVRTAGWRVQPNAIVPIGHAGRFDGCTQCGECIVGCRNPGGTHGGTAKRGTNVTYAPLALATGRCEFRTGVFVTAVLTEERSGEVVARAVRYRDAAGDVHEQDASCVVLCAGAIESPRLWLACGLPGSAAVGRSLTTHHFDYVTGVFDHDVDMFEGQTSMARADFPGLGFIESQGLGPLTFALATSFGVPGAARAPFALRGRTWGSTLKRRMELYRRTAMIAVCVDDEAVEQNGVTLSASVSDENNPAPRVRYVPTRQTVARRDWLARRAADVLIAAGADPDSIARADAAPSTIHMHGTMRMGTDPATSVVDPDGEAHAVQRLFVADTSVFPDGLGGPNPTLTAQAVATRTAERIVERYF